MSLSSVCWIIYRFKLVWKWNIMYSCLKSCVVAQECIYSVWHQDHTPSGNCMLEQTGSRNLVTLIVMWKLNLKGILFFSKKQHECLALTLPYILPAAPGIQTGNSSSSLNHYWIHWVFPFSSFHKKGYSVKPGEAALFHYFLALYYQ